MEKIQALHEVGKPDFQCSNDGESISQSDNHRDTAVENALNQIGHKLLDLLLIGFPFEKLEDLVFARIFLYFFIFIYPSARYDVRS